MILSEVILLKSIGEYKLAAIVVVLAQGIYSLLCMYFALRVRKTTIKQRSL